VPQNDIFQKIGTCTRNGRFFSVFGDNIVKEL